MRQISRRMEMIHPTTGWRRDQHGTHSRDSRGFILWFVSRVRSKTMHSLYCITSWLPYITLCYIDLRFFLPLEQSRTALLRTLYLGLVRAHLGYATQVWAPQGIELISKLESIQRRATKFILCLPFLTNISYKERLMSVNLLPVCYWHELLDLVYFYKATHNMIHLDPSVVPFVRECARRTRISVTSPQCFEPKKCRTSTFQKSFFIRTTRIWNLLITRLDLDNVTFENFKSALYGLLLAGSSNKLWPGLSKELQKYLLEMWHRQVFRPRN